ncbi:protein RALF-like 32 [Punica granatum]|uniref:Uncharacterized protein n=2 Tax=Punica granatum TaxID=22663 RepID=A0A218WVR8_PUNGR|nr:protein RALF-like 32 [Punica granatum]OWM76753.1 hypothetical protein CDL15_Pgr004965 [Punica granatum]PKI77247.1 hypothetical protein CRG98_002368 [Punica granatum]
MSKHTTFFLQYNFLIVFFVLHLLVSYSRMAYADTATCNGLIAECDELTTEFVFDSEVSRRFMEESRHLSYGALRKDQPTCSGGARGQAYSKSDSCGLPSKSNPHSPSCPKYYRCRSGS